MKNKNKKKPNPRTLTKNKTTPPKKTSKPKKIVKKQDTKRKTNNIQKKEKKMNYFLLTAISLIIISLLLNLLFYEQLPQLMITHWNFAGEANGFTPKEITIFLLPVTSAILFILMHYLPKIDPLKKNVIGFRKEYDLAIIATIFFVFYLNLITLVINLGMNINLPQSLIPAFFVLIYVIGLLLKKSKKNFFIGIKTPWTLSSETVWEKTHKKASKLFKASAILSLVGLIVPELTFFFIVFPIIISSIALFIYSYFKYKEKEEDKKK